MTKTKLYIELGIIGILVSEKDMFKRIDGSPKWMTLTEMSMVNFNFW